MVKINKSKCIGCGLCAAICPEVFEVTDEGKSSIKEESNLPCVEEAKKNCPVQAIEN